MTSLLTRMFMSMFVISGTILGFASAARCEEPEKVSVCQLKDNPAAYNHKLIEVTGLVSHGFEDFGLFDPICASFPYVWLEYGGKTKSGTMYCCGVSADRSRPKELIVEDIQVPLLEDEMFKQFDNLIHLSPASTVHASLLGRFFSGKERHYPKAVSWGGYGHMGCCSLLAIQQVISVDPHSRADLDYAASPDQPKLGKVGCGYRDLVSLLSYNDSIVAQRRAELGQGEWAFDDPQRVASDALGRLVKIDQTSIQGLKQTRAVQGRMVYEWVPLGKDVSYMVVVSRPYWLSFYARDASKVAWVVIAAYESSCNMSDSIQRLR